MPRLTPRDPERGPDLDAGDRVTAACHLGGIWRPRVRRGTPGMVIARAANGGLQVRFATGRTLTVASVDVTLAGPAATTTPDR